MKLFSNTINSLESGLNYSSLKQKVISNNIANVDTPNYKAKTVSFKQEFNNALSLSAKRTNGRHFEFQSKQEPFRIVENTGVTYNTNGNSVDIDKEMTNLAQNQIYYNSLIESLNREFNSLKTVIRGGR